MALKSIEILKKEMQKGFPFWQIIINNKPTFFNDDITDVDASFLELEDSLSYLDDSFATIKLSNRTKKDKAEGGDIKSDRIFNVRLNNGGIGLHTENKNVSDEHLKTIKENFELKNELQQKDNQIKSLIDRFDALEERMLNGVEDDEEEEETSPTDEIIGALKPYIPVLLNKFLGNQMQQPVKNLAGVEEINNTENVETITDEMEQQKQKAIKAVVKLLKLDNKAGDRLEGLATLCETKPDTYLMAANMLQSFL
jgi:hypothetical protein